MSRFSRDIDLVWTSAGDLLLNPDTEDLYDTENLVLRSLAQRVHRVLMSSTGDWPLQPRVGSNLSHFSGRPNTAETGLEIRQAVSAALSGPDMLNPGEINVDVFPVDKRSIALIVQITPMGSTERLYLNYVYDTRDNKIVPRSF